MTSCNDKTFAELKMLESIRYSVLNLNQTVPVNSDNSFGSFTLFLHSGSVHGSPS